MTDAKDSTAQATATLREHANAVFRRRPVASWTDGAGPHEVEIDGRTLIGSAPDAGIPIADRAVSRIHAELDPREDGLWIVDLGSRNGTFIGEVRVASARVPRGGKIRTGATEISLHDGAAPRAVEIWPAERFGPLRGRAPGMRELFARLSRIAATDASVLITGETGTGKELVASAIHDASPRGAGPFIIVDCAALPESLMEAELFGHAKGAFTGAAGARTGAIEAANGGTVFLDEIGELPLSVQPKLLRALESHEVRRVGESAYRRVDVRFIAATHRDLRTMVNVGAFREDLYFRLAVLPVTIPPLRDRAEDIPLLVEHLLGEGAPPLGAELLRELITRPWLGNVRELRNFVERSRALGAREALAMSAADAAPPGPTAPSQGLPQVSFDRPYKDVRADCLERLEREYFRYQLDRHERSVPKAAQAAGVDRTYVYRLMRRYAL